MNKPRAHPCTSCRPAAHCHWLYNGARARRRRQVADRNSAGFEIDAGGASTVEAEELSLTAEPADAALVERYRLTDAAGRVALVSAFYQVAVNAGLAADYPRQASVETRYSRVRSN